MNIHLEDRALLGLKGRDKEAFFAKHHHPRYHFA